MHKTRRLSVIFAGLAMLLTLGACSDDDPAKPGGSTSTNGAKITIDGTLQTLNESSWAYENGTPTTVIMAKSGDTSMTIMVPAAAGTYDTSNPFVPGMGIAFRSGAFCTSDDPGSAHIVLETFSQTTASGSFTGLLYDEEGVLPDPISVSGTFTVPHVFEEPADF